MENLGNEIIQTAKFIPKLAVVTAKFSVYLAV